MFILCTKRPVRPSQNSNGNCKLISLCVTKADIHFEKSNGGFVRILPVRDSRGGGQL